MSFDTLLLPAGIFAVGLAAGYIVRPLFAGKSAKSVEARAKKELEEAKVQDRELVLEAKDKSSALLEEIKKEEKETKNALVRTEERLSRREEDISKQLKDMSAKETRIAEDVNRLTEAKGKIVELQKKAQSEFERISALSSNEALSMLFTRVEEDSAKELAQAVQKMEHTRREEIEKKSL